MRIGKIIAGVIVSCLLVSCSAYKKTIQFPPSSDIFITSGDGDIQKPYEPIGEFIYADNGFKIPLPIIGLIAWKQIMPDKVLREEVSRQVKAMGGDALINMRISFEAPKSGVLGFGATGGYLFVTGTVIKR